jgi:hypothetical protein
MLPQKRNAGISRFFQLVNPNKPTVVAIEAQKELQQAKRRKISTNEAFVKVVSFFLLITFTWCFATSQTTDQPDSI